MELHSETANRKIGDDDDDLAEYMRQAGAGASVVDMAQMICDEDRIVLLDGDALCASLENASQNGEGRDVQYFSMRRIEPNEDAAKSASGQQPGLIVMMRKKNVDMDNTKLARETKTQLGQAQPERRSRILNLGLGAAIFALMSVTSLVILSPPYSYAVAAGALAPACIMLARAARKNA